MASILARQQTGTPPAADSSSHDHPNHHQPTVQRSTSDGVAINKRARVCKACNRCRLKKSKCDGSLPCLRCQADNAICEFGPQKKPLHDRPHPKGYVEMLEQQRSQLVSGLREMYRRLQEADAWAGPVLSDPNGLPLTHDILASLNILQAQPSPGSGGGGGGGGGGGDDDLAPLTNEMLDADDDELLRELFAAESDLSTPRSSELTTPMDSEMFQPGYNFPLHPPQQPQPQQQRQQQSAFLDAPRPQHWMDDGGGVAFDPQHLDVNVDPTVLMENDPLFFQTDWAAAVLETQQQQQQQQQHQQKQQHRLQQPGQGKGRVRQMQQADWQMMGRFPGT